MNTYPIYTDLSAHYRCKQCKTEWQAELGLIECPACGHHYAHWTNADAMQTAIDQANQNYHERKAFNPNYRRPHRG